MFQNISINSSTSIILYDEFCWLVTKSNEIRRKELNFSLLSDDNSVFVL